jgi:hypothetical protein
MASHEIGVLSDTWFPLGGQCSLPLVAAPCKGYLLVPPSTNAPGRRVAAPERKLHRHDVELQEALLKHLRGSYLPGSDPNREEPPEGGSSCIPECVLVRDVGRSVHVGDVIRRALNRDVRVVDL